MRVVFLSRLGQSLFNQPAQRAPWSSRGNLLSSAAGGYNQFRNQKYVPPYDRREQHLPGMNFCGPGTNVSKRLRQKVQPMDALDKLCLEHDIWTEPRGPYRSRGKRSLLRAADRTLLKSTQRLLKAGYQPQWKAAVVITAMDLLLTHGGRGR